MTSPRAALAAACLAAFALALGLAAEARAEPRYALVIGSNRGVSDEEELRFAERDAQRVADVLVRLGGVAAEDLVVLPTPTRAEVDHALAAFRARIGAAAAGRGATLFVYYSGHADSQALHLSGQRFGFSDLKAAVRALGVDVSILLVDACRSGGILRAKGLTPTEPFVFEVEDRLVAEGLAIITSSAENEDAQESDELGGGVFTHHLVAGLLGAADTSRDAAVTLGEAFRYAYAQTLAATSTSRVVQHPTYALDLQGRDEIVVTRLATSDRRGHLAFHDAGHYLVVEALGIPFVVAEVEAERDVELSLLPGRYLVRRREDAAVYEAELAVRAGATTALAAAAMARIPFRHAVRKGYGQRARSALSLGADGELAGALLDGTGLLAGMALTAQLDGPDLALRARLRWLASASENSHVAMDQRLLGLDVGLFHVFDLGRHGVGFGVRAGVDWLAQRFTTRGSAPDVDEAVGRVGPFGRIELALGGAVALELDVGVEVYLLEVATDALGLHPELTGRVVPTASLGLGVVLP